MRMCARKMLIVAAVVAFLAVLFIPAPEAVSGLRHTIGTRVLVTQITATKEAEPGLDKEIPSGIIRAVHQKIGYRYRTLQKLGSEAREANLGEEEDFTIFGGENLTIRVVGYSPSKKLIDLKIQTDMNVVAMSVKSGTHIVVKVPRPDNGSGDDDKDKAEDDESVQVLIISPRLLQIER